MNNAEKKIEKTDLILLLLLARGSTGSIAESIKGITKLMKLLFLLEKEGGISDGFTFKPYKMGPFSGEVYSQLEFLSTFPAVESPFLHVNSRNAKAADMLDSSVNVEQIKVVEDVAGSGDLDNNPPLTSEEVNVEFKLSPLGIKFANKISEDNPELFSKIEEIKTKYSGMGLRDLLRYVYLKYPELTTKTEIKEQLFQ